MAQAMGGPRLTFRGLRFWGSEHLPRDMVLLPGVWATLANIRDWAIKQGLVWDPEQMLTRSRFEDAAKWHVAMCTRYVRPVSWPAEAGGPV